jgi:hypothetical protein
VSTVVFLGPSLNIDAAQALLPEAIFLPPAQESDVLSAIGTYSPDCIGLIDGTFDGTLSVWHKEILYALHLGVRVVGGASMGALRAAEMHSLGMVGVGTIYRMYRDGDLTDDDEVALLHTGPADAYRALTEPMVNIRATLDQARSAGRLSACEVQHVLEAARCLHFARRTIPLICASTGLPVERLEAVRSVFADAYVDAKAADARLVLEELRRAPPARKPRPQPARSRAFERLYNNDRRVRHTEVDVPLQSIATHAALHALDFDELNAAALDRALIVVLAELLEARVTTEDVIVEVTRFRRERGLTTPEAVQQWQDASDLTPAEFSQLIKELALVRRMRRWVLGSHHAVSHTRWLLDELRLRGRYVESAADTAAEVERAESVTAAERGLGELDGNQIRELLRTHGQATGRRPTGPPGDWAREAGFKDVKDLAYELLRARRARESEG